MGSSTLTTTFELSVFDEVVGTVEVLAREDLSKIILSISGVWARDFCSSSLGESTHILTMGCGGESGIGKIGIK